MKYRLLASGSDGNAVLYHDSILVDCGIPFSMLKPYMYQIQIVLLTHEHRDHINVSTLFTLAKNRPTLRIGCCEWMVKLLPSMRNIDVYQIETEYNYGSFSLIPVKLYHDVPNVGYRIFKDDYKIFHATDTEHLNGITAKGYDLYAIEHNYNDETIRQIIYNKESIGGFAHERQSINSHLSEQEARRFIYNNKGDNYEVLRLHESKITTL